MNYKNCSFKKKILYDCDYFFVAAIIFAMFNILFLAQSIYPFGDKVILFGDSYYQLGRFIGHVFDVFEGRASIFYTNRISNGIEIFSTMQYMYLNPFYLIVLPFGREVASSMMSFSVLGMCIFNGSIFLYFAKKHFKNLNQITRVLLALMFTFGSYFIYCHMFITWMIFPGVLLLAIDGFIELINKKKIAKFTLCITWLVCTCFGIGISANVILVVLFSSYILFVLEKDKRKEVLPKFFIAYLITVIISVIILFPSIVAMTQTSRLSYNLMDAFTNMSTGYDVSIKISAILLDAFAFIMAILYFIFCNKKSKENKFFFFTFALLLFPNLFNSVLKLLCFGSYYGLPFRLTYLNQVFVFLLAAKFFNSKPLEKLERKKSNKIFVFLITAMIAIFVICFVLMFIFFGTAIGSVIKNGSPDYQFVYWVVPIFVSFAVLIAMLLFLSWRKILSKQVVSIFGVALMIISIALNFTIYSFDFDSTEKGHEEVAAMMTVAEPNSLFTSLHPEKDRHISYFNNFLSSDLRTGSLFSSLSDRNAVKSYFDIGLASSPAALFSCGTALSDSLLGIRYYVSTMNLDRPYLELVEKRGIYRLYENKLATTGAVVLDNDFKFNENLSAFENLEALRESLGVGGKLFESVELETEIVELDEEYKGYLKFIKKYTYTAERDCLLYANGGIVYLSNNLTDEIFNEDDIALCWNTYDDATQNDISFVKAGETVTFYIYSSRIPSDTTTKTNFTVLDYETLTGTVSALKTRETELEFTKDGYSVKVPENLSGNLTVFAADILGMNYTLNGEKVNASHIISNWASFEVSGGEVIVATFHFKSGKLWILLLVLGITLIAVLIYLQRKYTFEKLYKPLRMMFYVVNIIILSIFFLFGVVLTIFV